MYCFFARKVPKIIFTTSDCYTFAVCNMHIVSNISLSSTCVNGYSHCILALPKIIAKAWFPWVKRRKPLG
jgi:hypothetical protein